MKKQFVAVLVAGILLMGASILMGAQSQPQTQTPPPKTAAKQPQAKTQQEYDAFKKFEGEPDMAKKALAGEQFIKDYPDSELTGPYATPLLVDAYQRLNNFQKVVEYGEKALLANPPQQTVLFIYQAIVIAYQQLNNYEKTVEWSEKFLTADHNNTFALYMLATVVPERIKDDDLDRQQKLDHTTDYAKKLLEVTNTTQKPATITEDQWKMQRSQLQGGAYSALGFVALHKKNYDEAISEYKKSLEVYPKDAIAYYRLGLSYSFAKKNDEALKALATSVAMNGPAQARSYLEQLYKAKNNGSLDGLDKVIGEAASGLK
jgi:tetratricopeptide (TPR) repeat protein